MGSSKKYRRSVTVTPRDFQNGWFAIGSLIQEGIPCFQVTCGRTCKCCGEKDDSHDPVAKHKGIAHDVSVSDAVRRSGWRDASSNYPATQVAITLPLTAP